MSQPNVTMDPYNRGGMWAFLLSVSFSLVFFIWVSFIHPGVNLNEIPSEVQEIIQAEKAATGSATASADKGSEPPSGDPWVSTSAWIAQGQQVYKANCAVCHGDGGKGDGPGSGGLARNLVEGQWKVGGDSVTLFKTVAGGISGTTMVGFSHIPVNDRWALVHFIRSITSNKVADDAKTLETFAASAK